MDWVQVEVVVLDFLAQVEEGAFLALVALELMVEEVEVELLARLEKKVKVEFFTSS